MITVYPVDNQQIWTGEVVEQDERSPLRGYTDSPPELSGSEVAIRLGGKWRVLPHYPVVPTPGAHIPDVVSMRQGRLALLAAGLLDHVETAINSLDEPDKTKARIEWEYAQEMRRDYPWVIQLATAVGITESQIDELFVAAALL